MTPSSRIYIIGMMGAGKTTMGKKIARLLGYAFIDLDNEIEKVEGERVADLFGSKGEDYFRKRESEVLRQITGDRLVIATGGGTPCFNNNMEYMLQDGISVYLKADIKFIFQRVARFPAKRPLLLGKNESQMKAFLVQKMAEREPYYLQASHVFSIPACSAETIVKSIG